MEIEASAKSRRKGLRGEEKRDASPCPFKSSHGPIRYSQRNVC